MKVNWILALSFCILLVGCKKDNSIKSQTPPLSVSHYKPNVISGSNSGSGILGHVINNTKKLETFILGKWDQTGKTSQITRVIVREMGTDTISVINFDSLSRIKYSYRTSMSSNQATTNLIRCDYNSSNDTVKVKYFGRLDSASTVGSMFYGVQSSLQPILMNSCMGVNVNGNYSAQSFMNKTGQTQYVAEFAVVAGILLFLTCYYVYTQTHKQFENKDAYDPLDKLMNSINKSNDNAAEGAVNLQNYIEQEQNGSSTQVAWDSQLSSSDIALAYDNNTYIQNNPSSEMDYWTSGGVDYVTDTYAAKTMVVNDCTSQYYLNCGTNQLTSSTGTSNIYTFACPGFTSWVSGGCVVDGYNFAPDGTSGQICDCAGAPMGVEYSGASSFTYNNWSNGQLTIGSCDRWNGNPFFVSIWHLNTNPPTPYAILTISNRPAGAN